MACRRLFGMVLFTIFVLLTSIASGPAQGGPAADGATTGNGEASLPSFSMTANDQWPKGDSAIFADHASGTVPAKMGTVPDLGCCQSCSSCRWTASAEFITVDRVGSVDRTLVELVDGTVPPGELHRTFGPEALNACNFREGFAGGPKIGLTRHGDSGYDWELSYFQIDGWSSARSVGPYDHDQTYWLVMRAPVGFLQTQDTYQSMAWNYASKLNNLELNARWNLCGELTLLAGLRWVEMRENLQGTLPPPTFS